MTSKEEDKILCEKIARILDECRQSNAVHNRKLKELSAIRSASTIKFFPAFSKTINSLFVFSRKTVSAERIVRFVAFFCALRDEKSSATSDAFLEEFLRFLLIASRAVNRTTRFRACQIISEIIMRLPDDAEVSNELWDEVIDGMKQRVEDKVPAVRTFAVRALARFANDLENSDIVDLFLQLLEREQNAEARKVIVLSLPPSNTTSTAIIDCTRDVSEAVRRSAYSVLANKFPLQSLSIKLRAIILQRGIADRSSIVSKECLKLMKDMWLKKCCSGDPVALLKFLDVETYEAVGEAVMDALLKDDLVHVKNSQSIKHYITPECDSDEGTKLMDAEVALYWRTLCQYLQTEAQAKGSDAASTTGAEAAVYAAEASDNNDFLERILPSSVSDYIDFVKAHLSAGSNYRFSSRQLLLLGTMLDFSDVSNRKVASTFIQELLYRPLDHDIDDDGNAIVLGDGINLGGDHDWAKAVAELTKKVHASTGEFESVLTNVIEQLGHPCRERSADFMQWMHCLAVVGLLLENVKSILCLRGKAIEPSELLHSLLLPGAKHTNADVRRVAIRCLGLFGLVDRTPNEELVKQLRLSFINGPMAVSVMASKSFFDLGLRHGIEELDRAIGLEDSSEFCDVKDTFTLKDLANGNGVATVKLINLLICGFDRDNWWESIEGEHETVHVILGEGFAKILLLSEKNPCLPEFLHPTLLRALIFSYFDDDSRDLHRLKQCLSVFFEHYPALSLNHKKSISRAFIPTMRSMWPGIHCKSSGAPSTVSNLRKRATQASKFMLQMMQTPLYPKDLDDSEGRLNTSDSLTTNQPATGFEYGEEGLAIRIAVEVASYPGKKTASEKAYISALCRILASLHLGPSDPNVIKCARTLLSYIAKSVLVEKDVMKELKGMAERLKALDRNPDLELPRDQMYHLFGKLDLNFALDIDVSVEFPITTSLATKPTASNTTRRRMKREESSDDEDDGGDQGSPLLITPQPICQRSQRASKTAAMSRIVASRAARVAKDDESGITSDDTSSEESDDSQG